MNKKGITEGAVVFGAVVLIVLAVIGLLALMPLYGVWAQGLSGKADLREAEWNKKIAIEEAKAELDSAELKKQADVIRAEGIADANRIISASLTKEYIQWKWVEGLNDGSSEVIYVPTEANLPILEARG